MFRLSLLTTVMFVATYCLQAQKHSNEFLSIGVGARAQAMAGAQLASVRDATSGFWNPAGLVGVDTDLQLAAMHNEWFASIGRYDYIGLAAPIANKSRYLGFTFIRFGVDNIPNTGSKLIGSALIKVFLLPSVVILKSSSASKPKYFCFLPSLGVPILKSLL